MAIYEILDTSGVVVTSIIANQEFVEKMYPGLYRLVPEIVEVVIPPPTEFELLRTDLAELKLDMKIVKDAVMKPK